MADSFRFVLRHATLADHERVDRLLSDLDIASHNGLCRFLTIHSVCFFAMREAAPEDSIAYIALTDMLHRTESDLKTLGGAAGHRSDQALHPINLLALDYVIEGSRLGSRVLKTRWQATTDADVARADAYFSMPPVPGRWREVCDTLSSIPPNSAQAARIVRDTATLFDLFHRVSTAQLILGEGAAAPLNAQA